MASAIFSGLKKLWPFSLGQADDLKISDELVSSLSIPEHTKQFVFAIRDPNSHTVIYILAAQNLSEQSALDAEYLIKAVQPDAVVAQVTSPALSEIEEKNKLKHDQLSSVPTSSFGVLRGCFVNKISKEQYENLAGSQVLQAIFGVGFYGHFFAAKKAAEEVDSRFFLLESPVGSACGDHTGEASEDQIGEAKMSNAFASLLLQPNGLIQGGTSSCISSSKRLALTDTLQPQMLKSLASVLTTSVSKSSSADSIQGLEWTPGDCLPKSTYQAPSFALSVYSLLTDLHSIFIDLPDIRKALLYAQKILMDINKGDPVDPQFLSQVHNFCIAVEGLRVALNSVARVPSKNVKPTKIEFSDLPSEDKCHVLLAQALKSQTKRFRSMVAVVDASSLAGLRKHWNTPLPGEIVDLAEHCFLSEDDEGAADAGNMDQKRSLSKKPVVAVGAGATAVLGASSISKAIPASTFMKIVTYKVPAFLKIGLQQSQRAVAVGLGKILSPSKILAPGLASSGSKASALKVTVSAEKIRAVAHSVIASVEKTSFQATRSAFYEIMRRRSRPIGYMPWAAFGCSIATCTGLLFYGDGIECVAESAPSASTIACVGRGLQSLEEASRAVRQKDGGKVQESMKSLLNRLKKVKLQ